MSSILVVNSGSSSFKYQLIETANGQTLATGLVERIGEKVGRTIHTTHVEPTETERTPTVTTEQDQEIPDHTRGFQAMLDAFEANGPTLEEYPPRAVGHRVTHGGEFFDAPTVITDDVKKHIKELFDLAPLHNPANLQGIEAAQQAFPAIPHVAVFDTAFHQTLPPEAYTYAIDAQVAKTYHIRRYGFHGTSHKYVSETAADFIQKPLTDLKQIVLHLGSGASAAAIDGGTSVDTSMGFTPLEGLVMGTRSGDLDPAILIHLLRQTDMNVDDIDSLLNRRSGLLGLSGVNDMRDLKNQSVSGDETAQLALDVYIHRLRGYIGKYLVRLCGVDIISFTAGVGENAAFVRSAALKGLESFGIEIDEERNEAGGKGVRRISTDTSPVVVLVVPTNEELEIARQTIAAIG